MKGICSKKIAKLLFLQITACLFLCPAVVFGQCEPISTLDDDFEGTSQACWFFNNSNVGTSSNGGSNNSASLIVYANPVLTDWALPEIDDISEKTLSFYVNISGATGASHDVEVYLSNSQTANAGDKYPMSTTSVVSFTPQTINLDFRNEGFTASQYAYIHIQVMGATGTNMFFDDFVLTDFGNDAPTDITLTGSQQVIENNANEQIVGTLSTTDPDNGDTFTYSLSGTNASDFRIETSDNSLRSTATFNFEQLSSLSIDITTTDQGGLSYTESFTIPVIDQNDPPHDISISNTNFDENSNATTLVGVLSASDEDQGDVLTFSLSATGTSSTFFYLDGNNGENVRLLRSDFDYEQDSIYLLDVIVTDQSNATYQEQLTIKVNDIDEGTCDPVAAFSEDFEAVTLNQRPDCWTFDVASNFSVINFRSAPVGSGRRSLSVSVPVASRRKLLFPKIDNISNKIISFYLWNNSGSDRTIYVSVTDSDIPAFPNDVLIQSLTVPTGVWERVEIDFNELSLPDGKNNFQIDFTTAAGLSSLFFIEAVEVTEVNQAPTDILLSNQTILENNSEGALLGVFSTIDPNVADTHTYTIEDSSGTFEISADSLLVTKRLDYEAADSYAVAIVANDGDTTFRKAFTIGVEDVDETPEVVEPIPDATIDEDTSFALNLGTYFFEPDGDTLSFSSSILAGDSLMRFEENGPNIGMINNGGDKFGEVIIATVAADPAGNQVSDTFTISIVPVNDPPSFQLSPDSLILDMDFTGTEVVTISPSPSPFGEQNETVVFSITPTSVDFINLQTDFTSGSITFSAVERQFGNQSFTITADDEKSENNTFTQELVVIVNEQNVAPTDVLLSDTAIAENQQINARVATLTTIDQNSADEHTYQLSGADASSFTISDDELLATESFNYEEKSSYVITIETTDLQGRTFSRDFTIYILDQNDPPTSLVISSDTISEERSPGTLIAELEVEDEDATDSFTFQVLGTSATDFSIEGNQLLSATEYNFETKNSYQISIMATDQAGASIEQTFTIEIIDRNDPPSSITISSDTISEKRPIGSLVGQFEVEDEDINDQITLELSGADAAEFTLEDSRLLTAAEYDFAAQSAYQITVKATDSQGASIEQAFTIEIIERPLVITSSGNLTDMQLEIYPNPASSSLYIEGLENGDVIRLYNLNGQLLYQNATKSPAALAISVRSWDAGVYMLHIHKETSKVVVKKVIVMKK